MLERWKEFRRKQRAALRESNRSTALLAAEVSGQTVERDERVERVERGDGGLLNGVLPPTEGATHPAEGATHPAEPSAAPAEGDKQKFGPAGRPLNRQSPFYVGFIGAVGVLVAIGLWHTLGRLTTVITLLVVALFLTLALNPLVEAITRGRIKRPAAVGIVFACVLVVFTLLGLLVVPPVIQQGAQLVQEAPGYADSFLKSRVVRQMDRDYGVVDKISEEFKNRVTDSGFISQVFGGVLGAGRLLVTGVFQFFTVMILTLFFLSSLPRVKHAAYQIVPASRRPRVESLSEEIMRRTGSYAIGQVAVATLNAFCSWIMMTIVGIPYAAVLAVLAGFLGLVPMVGAGLAAALVCTVALFDEPHKAVIALIYYIIYQQIENYVIVPRVMQRTVFVPGAVTVVAALAGGTLLGMLGALLAIPFAAGLLLLYEEVLLPRQRRH